MSKWNTIIIILMITGLLLIITGVALEIREMFVDHFCYELTPYEFNKTPKCEKYKEVYYDIWKKKQR